MEPCLMGCKINDGFLALIEHFIGVDVNHL